MVVVLLSAGCFDITEELWLNKDRSGRYEMTVSVLSGPFASMLRMAQDKSNDSLRALGKAPRSADTLIRLGDLPDSLKRRFAHPEILDRIVMQTRMTKGLEVLFKYDFRKMEELPFFWETLSTLDALQKDSTVQGLDAFKVPGANGAQGMGAGAPDIQFDGKTVRRISPPDSTNLDPGALLFDHDSDPFVKMLFSNKKYRLIYHLPKKVKSVQGTGYRIDGKTVSAEFPLFDVVRDKGKLSCAITLK